MKRGPKSNVGVKSLKKSGSVNSARSAHRHKRKSSTSSSKGKRKRNSYVSSSITTKNFYPVEHFFRNTPADNNGFYNHHHQHASTLPANMSGYSYHNQYYPPKAPDGRLYGNMMPSTTYENLKPADLSRPVLNGVPYMHHQQQQHRDFLHQSKLEQRRFSDYQQQPLVGANPISTMTIDRRLTPTFRAPHESHLGTLPRTNPVGAGAGAADYWDTWKYNQQRKWSFASDRQQQQQHRSTTIHGNPTAMSVVELEPTAAVAAGAQLSHKQRQIIPTAATGICVSRNDSFRRYKIPSPAAILDMINDKYISSKRKSKVRVVL